MSLRDALANARKRKKDWFLDGDKESRSASLWIEDLVNNLIRNQCNSCKQETDHHVWKKESGETVHQCKECGTVKEVQENEN